MFVRNQPAAARPSATYGRSYPYLALGQPGLARSAVQVKHVCERDICTRRNVELVGFQADGAVVLIKPPQEVAANFVGSLELDRGNNIVINDVGDIKGNETIDGINSPVQDRPNFGFVGSHCILLCLKTSSRRSSLMRAGSAGFAHSIAVHVEPAHECV